MRRAWLALLLIGLAACSTAPSGVGMTSAMKLPTGALPDLGPAPELKNRTWLNTLSPLHIADLRGKVVGIEMWTFDCINCQHVMPALEGRAVQAVSVMARSASQRYLSMSTVTCQMDGAILRNLSYERVTGR